MCGINGVVSNTASESSIKVMNEILFHRGPDGHGVDIFQNVALGHTRLKIIDLSDKANQPMTFKNLTIIFNGEIFNYKDIQKDLISKGYRFETTSDTEVLLKFIHHYGFEKINDLNGMFAFAVYDKEKNKLYLVRDRYGIKPLYIYKDSQKLIFSSEIKAILSQNVNLTLNQKAIKEYFQFLYIKHPFTPFNEIQKVKPGYIYEIDPDTLSIKEKKYYEIFPNEKIHDEKEALSNIEKLLIDSVHLRMISDREVGTFLSGGVDSGIITAIASSFTEKKLKTFSITFKNVSNFFDESQYALAVSKRYGTKHYPFEINFDEVIDTLEEIIYYLDEPIADTSTFLNFYISKLAREHVVVALSGLGGDELFGGYNRYQALLLTQKLSFLKDFKFLKNIKSNRTTKIGNLLRAISKISNSIEENLCKTYMKMISYEEILEFDECDLNNLNDVFKYDVKYYMNDNLLNFTDKMSMAHSLEVRVPFLDYRLVNFAFTLSTSLKVSIFQKKIILKKLAEKYLDKNIVYRKKQGFSAPIEVWLRKKGKEYISSLIDIDVINKFLSKDIIENNLRLFFDKGVDKSLQIYSYIVFSLWYKINKSKIVS